MRFSYKKLVDRFSIPRPTLIEWQKKAKNDNDNWRVKHLEYLREQILIEELTLNELKSKPLLIDDVFLLCVFIFFNKNYDYLEVDKFKNDLRLFAYSKRESIEYRHEFAEKVWPIKLNDDSGRKISNYHSLIEIINTMTIAQYSLLIRKIKEYVEVIENKIKPSYTNLLDGLTWQEIHMYDKYFSDKSIKKYFFDLGINHQ